MTISVMKSVAGAPAPPAAGTPKRTLLGVGLVLRVFLKVMGV